MDAILIRHIFAITFSCLFGLYLIPIVIKAAIKIRFFDAPDGKLKHQKEPVPYLGGIGVFIPFITTLGLCYPFQNHILWLLLGCTLLLFIGLIDDIKVLKPSQKFLGQTIAVLCFIKGGFSLKTDFMISLFHMGCLGFWMLTVINAFNLVDVMDGLCATLALCGALAFFVFSLINHIYTTSLLLAAFIGSILAFLFFNKPNAKIYLGDSGSLFIGGFLSTMPLFLSCPRISSHVFDIGIGWFFVLFETLLVPTLVLAVPLIEVASLFAIRSYIGIPFYNGSPHHFSIYLQKKGKNKWWVLLFATIMALLFSMFAGLFMYDLITWWVLAGGVLACLGAWVLVVFR